MVPAQSLTSTCGSQLLGLCCWDTEGPAGWPAPGPGTCFRFAPGLGLHMVGAELEGRFCGKDLEAGGHQGDGKPKGRGPPCVLMVSGGHPLPQWEEHEVGMLY